MDKEKLNELYGDEVRIVASASTTFINETYDFSEYYFPVECNLDELTAVDFRISNHDNQLLDIMFGYMIQFTDYSDVIFRMDEVSGDACHLAENANKYVVLSRHPQSIYLNLGITNEHFPIDTECYMYMNMLQMMQRLFHHKPDYIIGYIRKEAFAKIQDILEKQRFMIFFKDEDYYEIIWSKT